MLIKTREDRRTRIKYRIRKRVRGTEPRPRLTVFRSTAHIYVQVVDDTTGRTVASASSLEPSVKGGLAAQEKGGNIAGAKAIGRAIATRLLEKGVKRVVFDRNGFLYHGRVKAVADAAREAGLEF
ncbi:MAG: 50S ribosomal protein L18 [Vicinamibacterales bacterium]